jgi:hypothetical protein
MHKRAHYLIAAAGLMGVAFPVSAEPRNVVYQFQVLTESVRNCPIEPWPDPTDCPVTSGHAPYMLGVLTLTHQAFAKRHAQWASGSDSPGSEFNEKPVDDQGIVSWVSFIGGYPPESPYSVDLPPLLLASNFSHSTSNYL